MQDFSTVMVKNAATGTTDIVNSTNTPKKGIVPGFEFALALMATGAIIVLRKQS